MLNKDIRAFYAGIPSTHAVFALHKLLEEDGSKDYIQPASIFALPRCRVLFFAASLASVPSHPQRKNIHAPTISFPSELS